MQLPVIDIIVLVAYLAGVVVFGCCFVRKSRTTTAFMAAGRALPGWAVGLSIFGTYLSSNTFLGVPGKAFGGNWNSFVLSLSLPIAAIVAVKVFVPFYRRTGEISAYHHLEKRFGPWARTYALVCYLLTQVARIGAVMFGVALAMNALLGWDMAAIILVAGALVTLYTLLGGIEAVIWTDVVQSIVLMVGAVVVAAVILFGMPEGPRQAVTLAAERGKFSLGSFGLDLTQATFWVVLVYGLFINLTNFGIDQSYVQRYHAARSDREAGRSVWLGALLYVPVSALFFFIGTSLFSYCQTDPAMLDAIRTKVATSKLAEEGEPADAVAREANLAAIKAGLTDADVGDKALPHFIVQRLPHGLAGLLIAAIAAAAMSSIDTSLNSSATVILSDLYRRYLRPQAGEKESMRVLHVATLVWGALGTGTALSLIGVRSILDAWWVLSGIFAGGMLGLFLLGLIARRAGSAAAATAVVLGSLVILWMALSVRTEWLPEALRSPLHAHMIIVVGTLTIFLVGLLVSRFAGRRRDAVP